MTQKTIDCARASLGGLQDAFKNKYPITGIKMILTHPSPHLDEVAAIYMLQHTIEGNEKFPGVENVGVSFVSGTHLRENNFLGFKGFLKALQAGYLLIGLGDGPFDEHGNRDKKVSCLELIKRHLDLFKKQENRSIYGPLIHFVNHEDNNGDNIMRTLNKVNPETRLSKEAAEVCNTLNLGQIAQNLKKGFETAQTLEEQQQIFCMGMQFIKNEISQRKMFIVASNHHHQSIQLEFELGEKNFGLVIKNDNPLAAKVAFQKSKQIGEKTIGILIVEKTNGQFCIIPQDNFRESMREIIKILRQKVFFSKKQKSLSFDDLESMGWIWSVPELYIDENMFIIMNGSKTDPDVPGLIGKHLTINDVVGAIKIVIDKQFDGRHAEKCKIGSCVKVTDKKHCSLFCYNLNHCIEVRDKTAQELKRVGEVRLNERGLIRG
jgi:hypothetical protein